MYIELNVRTPEVSRNFLFADRSMDTNDLDGVTDKIVLFDTECDKYNCFAHPDKSKYIPFKTTYTSNSITIHIDRAAIGLSEVDRYGCKTVDLGVLFSRSDEFIVEKIIIEPVPSPEVTVNWVSEDDETGKHQTDEIEFCTVLLKNVITFGVPGTYSGDIDETEIDIASFINEEHVVFSVIDGFPVFENHERGYSIIVRKSYLQFIFEGEVTKKNYTYHPNPNSTFDVPYWFIKILRKVWLTFFRNHVTNLLVSKNYLEIDRIFNDMIREED